MTLYVTDLPNGGPTPFRKAASNRPSSWRSFREAVDCYHERPDYFDGIGYVFSAEGPYVGGDFDHCLDAQGALNDFARGYLPLTYAEVSLSGQGVNLIVRASLVSGRKTARAELYASGRFFTFTGRVLDTDHTTITEQQAAIDSLLAVLSKDVPQHIGGGVAGGGSRAEHAAQIDESVCETGRQLLRMDIERLLVRVRKAAGEETQLAVLLRGEYAAFHQRWPHVGLYRADGTLDASQVRAVAACGIKGRSFSFPEYLAIMSYLYAAEALAKWGAKQLWREELVALWERASAPNHPFHARVVSRPRAARGRASDHAALIERVYQLLEEHCAGAEALIRIGELASAAGVHRRTIATILDELRQAGRIMTRRAGRYAGLDVSFTAPNPTTLPAERAEQPIPDVISSGVPTTQPSGQLIPDVLVEALLAAGFPPGAYQLALGFAIPNTEVVKESPDSDKLIVCEETKQALKRRLQGQSWAITRTDARGKVTEWTLMVRHLLPQAQSVGTFIAWSKAPNGTKVIDYDTVTILDIGGGDLHKTDIWLKPYRLSTERIGSGTIEIARALIKRLPKARLNDITAQHALISRQALISGKMQQVSKEVDEVLHMCGHSLVGRMLPTFQDTRRYVIITGGGAILLHQPIVEVLSAAGKEQEQDYLLIDHGLASVLNSVGALFAVLFMAARKA